MNKEIMHVIGVVVILSLGPIVLFAAWPALGAGSGSSLLTLVAVIFSTATFVATILLGAAALKYLRSG